MDTDGVLEPYRRAQDGFDAVLAGVAPERWDTASACAGWTVRDVVGHVVWGQQLVRRLANGRQPASKAGAPGARSPGALAGGDPLGGWRAAREGADAVLTAESVLRPAPARFAAEHPGATLADFLELLLLDHLAHTWDIGAALGFEVRLPPDLLARSSETARRIVVRAPWMFGPELTPPEGAGEQARWLAYLGRDPRA